MMFARYFVYVILSRFAAKDLCVIDTERILRLRCDLRMTWRAFVRGIFFILRFQLFSPI